MIILLNIHAIEQSVVIVPPPIHRTARFTFQNVACG